ncbi:hypothetical protein CLV59_102268 [Chitinophaga dinghuensis]|uniref:Uncharacterized protein n=1 Tax=Chitinophaga dinghuensis TaxID=1539050 RepID=A0A327W851_9BACT|nr:hypothetical protein [Chitinophaga dinghuensis]RAJ85563.1 hypothetical protein CLV59_102268 [Chitinophaga dinghuensis]
MTRMLCIFAIGLFLLQACKTGNGTTEEAKKNTSDSAGSYALVGTYKGDFGGAPIFITINFSNGKQAAGYNIHKGLRRNIKGEIVRDGSNWVLSLTEPGDNPYDGKFTITFNADANSGNGTWTPNNIKATAEKKFQLEKMKSGEPYNEGMRSQYPFLGYFSAYENSGTIVFEEDGTVKMTYYPKVNDSTLAQQAIEVTGSWSNNPQQPQQVTVNWKTNSGWSQKSSLFKIEMEKGEETNNSYLSAIVCDSLRFVPGP